MSPEVARQKKKSTDEHKKKYTSQYAVKTLDKGHVALLLPLSGPLSRYAREIAAALEISFQNNAIPYLVYDTGQEGLSISDHVRDAKKAGSFFVLGALGNQEAKRMRKAALIEGMAIGLLAPMSPPRVAFKHIYYLWPSPEWEASQSAYAAKELGFEHVGFLSSRDSLGLRQRGAFERAFGENEEAQFDAGHYDPESRTLESDLRSFFRLTPSMNASFRRHVGRYGKAGWKTYTPDDLTMDLLYIADGVGRGALVASFLPYLNIVPRNSSIMNQVGLRGRYGGKIPALVQVFGSFGWNKRDLSVRGGEATEGALVLTMCPPHDETIPETFQKSFIRPFEKKRGRPPSRTAKIAYDVAEFVSMAASRHLSARSKTRVLTLEGGLKEGVCGPARLKKSGELERQVSLFRASGGGFDLEPW